MLSRFVKSSPLPPVVDHIFSELCTMTCPSRVALQDMAYSFTELYKPLCLDKAVINEMVIRDG